jgi:glycine cleavage system aminomethyltransferase T
VFVPADSALSEPPTFGRPLWTEHVAVEQRAALDGVTITDLTSMAKYELTGSRARAALHAVIPDQFPRQAGSVPSKGCVLRPARRYGVPSYRLPDLRL